MSYRRLILTFVITGGLLCFANKSQSQTSQSKPEAFPFELVGDGYMLIECTVNDTITGHFGFDTGGGIHVISQALADEINASYLKDFTAFQGHGERVDLEVYEIGSIGMGGYKQEFPIVTSIPGIEQMGIDGILSLKLLENIPFTIDFPNKKIILETENAAQQRATTGSVVPIKFNVYRDVAIDIFGEFLVYNDNGDSLEVELEFDTGRGYETKLNATLMEFFAIEKDKSPQRQVAFNTDPGKSFTLYNGTISQLSMKDTPLKIEDPEIIFQDNLIYDGLIGIELFKNNELTIDIPNARMIIN